MKQIYLLTNDFPKKEDYCLTSQIRRASISVPSNIAEGAGKNSTRDYIRFLDIALGSLTEVETQLIISIEVGYLKQDTVNPLFEEINEIGKMIRGLMNSLKSKLPPSFNEGEAEFLNFPSTNPNH